jgi:TrmH family RNA methyltransferase
MYKMHRKEAPRSFREQKFPGPNYNQLLLTQDQRDHFDVVLVSPRNPLNIGAAARAMANFGFAQLTVVAPFEAHWREARSAVGAPELLLNAKSTESLPQALAECTLVIGTGTLTYRKPEQHVVSLPDLTPIVEREFKSGGRVALIFGPEKHGLTRDDLSYCHTLVEIPTDSKQPSMNLGQAVAVCLYELTAHSSSPQKSLPQESDIDVTPAAPSADLELLAGVVEETMQSAGYSPRTMQAANRHDLRLLLRRLAPSHRDARRMLGLFRRILWRLKRGTRDADRE